MSNNTFPAFDPTQVAPSTGDGGGNLPVSDKNGHLVKIVDHEIKQTTKGDGGFFVAATLEIIDGPHAGTQGVHRFNIGNTNAVTVRIAYQELSAVCHCVGFLQQLESLDPLMNKPFRVIVDYQKSAEAKEKGYTEVKAFRDQYGNKPGESGGGNAPGPAAPPAPPAPGPAGPPQQPPQAPQAAQPGFPQQQAQNAPQAPPAAPQGQYQQPGPPQGQPQQQGPPQGYSQAPQNQQPQGQPAQQPQGQANLAQPPFAQQPQSPQNNQGAVSGPQDVAPPWGAPPQQ